MPTLALCLLCALTTAVCAAPAPAQHEELTLLLHGALQLGQALNGVYRATEAQLTEAARSLDLYGSALGLLGQRVSHSRDAAWDVHANLLEIQTEENALELQAEATAQALVEAAQAQQALQDSVRRLEARLQEVWLGQARHELEALKAYADKQSYIVWTLTGHVQRQKREMAAQQRWLQKIQERLHTAARPA
ncbi:angiopoietin-like protein 8 [Ctenodactylus gundi]